jgi:hypothetical protein
MHARAEPSHGTAGCDAQMAAREMQASSVGLLSPVRSYQLNSGIGKHAPGTDVSITTEQNERLPVIIAISLGRTTRYIALHSNETCSGRNGNRQSLRGQRISSPLHRYANLWVTMNQNPINTSSKIKFVRLNSHRVSKPIMVCENFSPSLKEI